MRGGGGWGGAGSYSVPQCVRPWIKVTPEYPFNFVLRWSFSTFENVMLKL